jgi:hypothetical protein
VRGNGGRSARSPLDVVNPLDLIVDGIVWQIRFAGRRIITGVVLLAAIVVMSVTLLLPLGLAGLLIAVFGLTVEPYKWVGSILILVAFVVGIVAVPLVLRRMIRRGRQVIAFTLFAQDDPADPFEVGPSPTVPARAAGPTREQWAAGIRALDDRLRTPVETPGRPGR